MNKTREETQKEEHKHKSRTEGEISCPIRVNICPACKTSHEPVLL